MGSVTRDEIVPPYGVILSLISDRMTATNAAWRTLVMVTPPVDAFSEG